jgi:hypothetical protein
MLLGVPACTAKDIGHFGLSSREMVCIDLEFVLYLKFLVCKGGISPIHEGL